MNYYEIIEKNGVEKILINAPIKNYPNVLQTAHHQESELYFIFFSNHTVETPNFIVFTKDEVNDITTYYSIEPVRNIIKMVSKDFKNYKEDTEFLAGRIMSSICPPPQLLINIYPVPSGYTLDILEHSEGVVLFNNKNVASFDFDPEGHVTQLHAVIGRFIKYNSYPIEMLDENNWKSWVKFTSYPENYGKYSQEKIINMAYHSFGWL